MMNDFEVLGVRSFVISAAAGIHHQTPGFLLSQE